MSERDAKLYLADIENALAKIEQYTHGLSFEQFASNELVIDAVVRNFEIIGEAVRNIPKATHERRLRSELTDQGNRFLVDGEGPTAFAIENESDDFFVALAPPSSNVISIWAR